MWQIRIHTQFRSPRDICGGNGGSTYGTPGQVEVTRRRPGSRYEVDAGWATGTSLTAYSKGRPSAGTLPYPIDVLYAGKRLSLRVTDTKDETNSYDSFNGVTTIVFQPRGRR